MAHLSTKKTSTYHTILLYYKGEVIGFRLFRATGYYMLVKL